jgi:predicted N-acetyltransferase YhbS
MIHVRPMTLADLPLGLRLTQQAGWNTLEADWRRFLELEPGGAFVAEVGGAAAGTAATMLFGPIAWVALVLVDASLRRRGIGTALMEHALAHLDRLGVPTVRLDATPLGQPVYENLGFTTEHVLTRYEGTAPHTESPAAVEPVRPEHVEALLRLDREATGTDRRKVILRLLAERPEAARVALDGGEVVGYATARPGARALYVGPCIVRADAGPLLFADAWARYAGRLIYMDVPERNVAARAVVEAAGLTAQRPLTRMCRGPRVAERVELLWASAGPEKG